MTTAENSASRFELRKCLFDLDTMYAQVESAAQSLGLGGTLRALSYASEKHKTQFRKSSDGTEPVPYIYHPLIMACHALALGLKDDDVLSAILLHDVYEDCGVALSEIPCSENVRNAIGLLSHNSYDEGDDDTYYAGIAKSPLASLVKCIDRCSNLSEMAGGFTRAKIAVYINGSERYVVPILEGLPALEPAYSDAAWLLRYQMFALLEMAKRLV